MTRLTYADTEIVKGWEDITCFFKHCPMEDIEDRFHIDHICDVCSVEGLSIRLKELEDKEERMEDDLK